MTVDETGDVKAITRAILREWPRAWVFKVVGNYRQRSGVPDLLVVIEGLMFALEVKHQRPGESLAAAVERATPLQREQIRKLRAAGAVAEVVTSAQQATAFIRARLERRTEHVDGHAGEPGRSDRGGLGLAP